MKLEPVPEFAVVGHPNEGKSSVVSTLTEDDSVRISPVPRETTTCRRFPVVIDGREIIGFVDTPGFQNPVQTLEWMKNHSGPDETIVADFRKAHLENPDFRDDCELFSPIAAGAGIIYVVDGSRPLRNVDQAEMEVLRLTGRPRMAIINCKEDETRYLDQWKSEFRKNFNAVRVFNAHRATYAERIDLLESLKLIDQDWQRALETVIEAFKQDWQRRNAASTGIICRMLVDALTCRVSRNFTEKTDEQHLKEALREEYRRRLVRMEKDAHRDVRKLFKHNIFNIDLPANSMMAEALFSDKTWQLLGLTPKQLAAVAGLSGLAVGAALDLAAHGLTFGVFSAIGGLAGVGWAVLGGAGKLARVRVAGVPLGGEQLQMGPAENAQLVYILLDRAFIYYSHIINWAHGRREAAAATVPADAGRAGITSKWSGPARQTCMRFFKNVRGGDELKIEKARREMQDLVLKTLDRLSHGDGAVNR